MKFIWKKELYTSQDQGSIFVRRFVRPFPFRKRAMGKAIVHLGLDLKVTWFETGSPNGPKVWEPIYPHSFGTGPNILDPLSERFRPKSKGTKCQ